MKGQIAVESERVMEEMVVAVLDEGMGRALSMVHKCVGYIHKVSPGKKARQHAQINESLVYHNPDLHNRTKIWGRALSMVHKYIHKVSPSKKACLDQRKPSFTTIQIYITA